VQVYSVIQLDNLAKLVPFATLGEMETIIVDAIRHGAPSAAFRALFSCGWSLNRGSSSFTGRFQSFSRCARSSELVRCPLHSLAVMPPVAIAHVKVTNPNIYLCSAAGFLAVRLDHRAGTLRFGAPGLDSDRMRDHISAMARRLTTAQHMIQPAVDPALEQRRLSVRLPPLLCSFAFIFCDPSCVPCRGPGAVPPVVALPALAFCQ